MNIVISHKKVKRSIDGTGFNLCIMNMDNLKTIARALNKAVEDRHLGWIAIRDPIEDEHDTPNTMPTPWVNP